MNVASVASVAFEAGMQLAGVIGFIVLVIALTVATQAIKSRVARHKKRKAQAKAFATYEQALRTNGFWYGQ